MKVWLQMQEKLVNVVTMQDTDTDFQDYYNYPSDASMMSADEVLLLVLLEFFLLEDVRAYAVEEIVRSTFWSKNSRQK